MNLFDPAVSELVARGFTVRMPPLVHAKLTEEFRVRLTKYKALIDLLEMLTILLNTIDTATSVGSVPNLKRFLFSKRAIEGSATKLDRIGELDGLYTQIVSDIRTHVDPDAADAFRDAVGPVKIKYLVAMEALKESRDPHAALLNELAVTGVAAKAMGDIKALFSGSQPDPINDTIDERIAAVIPEYTNRNGRISWQNLRHRVIDDLKKKRQSGTITKRELAALTKLLGEDTESGCIKLMQSIYYARHKTQQDAKQIPDRILR